jgi:hypothetical protein
MSDDHWGAEGFVDADRVRPSGGPRSTRRGRGGADEGGNGGTNVLRSFLAGTRVRIVPWSGMYVRGGAWHN